MVERFYQKISVFLIFLLVLPWGTIASFAAMATSGQTPLHWISTTHNLVTFDTYATPANAASSNTAEKKKETDSSINHTVATPGQSASIGADGVMMGVGELIDAREALLRDLTSSLSVSLPMELSFNIDLYDTLGKGQIYSPDYCFQNFSKVDVRIRINSISCEFSNPNHYQALQSLAELDRTSDQKQIFMYLEQQNGQPDVATAMEAQEEEKEIFETDIGGVQAVSISEKPGVVITDTPFVDGYSFILSADPEADDNQIRFRLLGEVNEQSRYRWRSGEVRIKAQFSIEPLVGEALEELDAEIALRQAMLYEEIPDEEDLYINEEADDELTSQEKQSSYSIDKYQQKVSRDELQNTSSESDHQEGDEQSSIIPVQSAEEPGLPGINEAENNTVSGNRVTQENDQSTQEPDEKPKGSETTTGQTGFKEFVEGSQIDESQGSGISADEETINDRENEGFSGNTKSEEMAEETIPDVPG